MQARIAIGLLRSPTVRTALAASVLMVICLPVLLAAAVAGMIAQEARSACTETGGAQGGGAQGDVPAGGGALAAGLYAAPLELRPGRWYEVGATEYGGPSDPSSGSYGSIPDPGQSYLPAHPDTFAELSVLDTNPTNDGRFTFADANALDHLAYLTQLRVEHSGREAVLAKRDIGYGQGPGQLIANGQPYRLDVWWQAARSLGITKSPVRIMLAPQTGAAATLGALAGSNETGGGGAVEVGECPVTQGGGTVSLPLTSGAETKILPSGLAAAGEEAPVQVKRMVAAGNRLFGASYLYGGAHGSPLDTLQGAYDCSSAVSYLLHAGGVLGPNALDSTQLAGYGLAGPGRYVSIYANTAHAFVYVAGLRFDTVEDPAYDTGPNAGKPGPKWRVSPTVPDWSTWTVRHPPGL